MFFKKIFFLNLIFLISINFYCQDFSKEYYLNKETNSFFKFNYKENKFMFRQYTKSGCPNVYGYLKEYSYGNFSKKEKRITLNSSEIKLKNYTVEEYKITSLNDTIKIEINSKLIKNHKDFDAFIFAFKASNIFDENIILNKFSNSDFYIISKEIINDIDLISSPNLLFYNENYPEISNFNILSSVNYKIKDKGTNLIKINFSDLSIFDFSFTKFIEYPLVIDKNCLFYKGMKFKKVKDFKNDNKFIFYPECNR